MHCSNRSSRQFRIRFCLITKFSAYYGHNLTMKKAAFLLVLPLALAGCQGSGQNSDEKVVIIPKNPGGKLPITTVVGSNGNINIGDTIAKVKEANPKPAEAQEFNSSMAFNMVSEEGWAWADEKSKVAFEVATKEGKVVAISQILQPGLEPNQSINTYGEPSSKSIGEASSTYVWKSGENARFIVDIKKDTHLLEKGTIIIVGTIEDLRKLNYNVDDPSHFTKQLDALESEAAKTKK